MFALDEPEDFQRRKLVDHHMRAAGESGVVRLAPSVGVKEGNGVELDRCIAVTCSAMAALSA